MKTSGYSGTPLAKKLGIKRGFTIQVFNTPKSYSEFFSDFPEHIIQFPEDVNQEVDFSHIFVSTWEELRMFYAKAKANLKINGILWVSWPKKSSSIPSEVGKFDIINYGLDNGLVDVKVAAIDSDWSGHKFVYRLIDRK